MDFSKAGAIDHAGNAFRADVQFKESGAQRHIRGPCRPDEEEAKEDLESMRAAASGMSREDGFAAMDVEADALKAGKPPLQAAVLQAAVRCPRYYRSTLSGLRKAPTAPP